MKWPLWIVAFGALVLLAAGAAWKMAWLAPHPIDQPPKLAEVPPLPAITSSSLIVTPVAISFTAIQDALEQGVPSDLSKLIGQNSPSFPTFPNAPNSAFNWSLTREPFAIAGGPEGLTLSSVLHGSIHATSAMMDQGGGAPGGFPGMSGGPAGGPPDRFPGAPPSFPGGPPPSFPGGPPPGFFRGPPGFPGPFGGMPSGKNQPQVAPQQSTGQQGRSDSTSDQSAEFNGQIVLTARPNLRPEWRMEPNLAAQVTIGETKMDFMGSTISLPDQVKPLIEQIISGQVAAFQAQTADNPMFEKAMREQWAKMCRTIPLGSGPAGAPALWLEFRPTRALAAQPRIDQTAVILTVGVRAETRIVTSETKPDCPFPAQLDIVPQMDQGQINIELPIDIPFAEVDRLIETQLKAAPFVLDKSGAFTATVRSAKLAASGDRLLLTMNIRANETNTWLHLGADATIHVWGRPVLDRARQQVHFDNIDLDVQSEAAFGALGIAAQAAMPYLRKLLTDHVQIDLAPLVANARSNIEAAIADFRENAVGTQLDAKVTDVHLAGIEFDAKTLRIIASAEGTVRVTLNKLSER